MSEHKYIFIHVPRTAGMAVKKCQWEGRITPTLHHTALEFKDGMTKAEWSDLFKFGFVRNPYDRFVSLFYYFKHWRHGWVDKDHVGHRIKRSLRYYKFKDFVYDYENYEFYMAEHFRPMHKFLCDDEDNILVDRHYYYEMLDVAVTEINSILGPPVKPLKVRNISQHPLYQDCYNSELAGIIYGHYEKDFKIFGYDVDLWCAPLNHTQLFIEGYKDKFRSEKLIKKHYGEDG